MKKQRAIPATVLEHARLAVETATPRKPATSRAPAAKREKPTGPKAKVIAALKKLHPMD